MSSFSEDKKNQIIEKLNSKNVNRPCPRCNNTQFTLVEGYFNQALQQDLKNVVMGGASIPSIITVCSNCGYLSQHALGALGLLPEKEEGDNNE